MSDGVKRYYTASYGERIFYPREPRKDYANGWPYEVILASDFDAYRAESEVALADMKAQHIKVVSEGARNVLRLTADLHDANEALHSMEALLAEVESAMIDCSLHTEARIVLAKVRAARGKGR